MGDLKRQDHDVSYRQDIRLSGQGNADRGLSRLLRHGRDRRDGCQESGCDGNPDSHDEAALAEGDSQYPFLQSRHDLLISRVFVAGS